MVSVTYKAEALLDIKEHIEYRSDYSDRAAIRFSEKLIAAIEQLVEYPELGRERTELAPFLRGFPVNTLRVTILYTPDLEKDTISIVRVLRQERDIEALFETDE